MEESIFSKIKSYTPTTKRDSKEDYLTELFAFIIGKVEGLAEGYCNFLISKIKSKNEESFLQLDIEDGIEIKTQVVVTNGRIDLLITNGNGGFICEHKVFSSLGKEQIAKYNLCKSEIGAGKFNTVLLTTSKLQHTEKADIQIVWGEVCKFLEDFINANTLCEVDDFLVRQLIGYLRDQGLGLYESIGIDEVRSNFIAQNFKEKLKEIFSNLKDVDWASDLHNLDIFNRLDYNPKIQDSWGRLGISLFNEWIPGIFIGVILNTADHKIEPLDKDKGPDFVVIAESGTLKNRNRICESNEFKELVEKLKASENEFELLYADLKNKYRMIVLRKPLIDIIKNKYTIDEQIEAIKDVSLNGLELMLQDDLIFKAFKNIKRG